MFCHYDALRFLLLVVAILTQNLPCTQVEIIGQKNVDETAAIKATETSNYRFNHTMIRVKDPEKSLKFYQDVMGMQLLRTSEQKEAGFTLYFLGYPGDYQIPKPEDTPNGVNPLAGKEGLLELTWNYGTEKKEGPVYHDGNSEPQGFGHICLSVENLDEACKFMDSKDVKWKKRLTEGRMKDVAFVLDPDGRLFPVPAILRWSNQRLYRVLG
jgi:lactoylglutathione lyase